MKLNEIKCPYCRNIFNNILPYYSILNEKKIRGVNDPIKYSFSHLTCQHKLTIGKNKNNPCNKPGINTLEGCFCCKHLPLKYLNYNTIEDYKKLTVVQLKEILKQNNCKVSGNKKELLLRIQNEKILIKFKIISNPFLKNGHVQF